MLRIESVSMRVSGGRSTCENVRKILGHKIQNTTFAACESSFGVSFAHALGAMVPSRGSSEVIVFKANEFN